MKVNVNIIYTRCMPMSEAVIVPRPTIMTSNVSEGSLTRDTHTHTYTRAHTHTRTRIRTHTHTHTRTYNIHTHTHTHARAHVHTNIHTHSRTHAHIHTHRHRHTHAHIHTHTRIAYVKHSQSLTTFLTTKQDDLGNVNSLQDILVSYC